MAFVENILIYFAIAGAVSSAAVFVLLRSPVAVHIIDVPNHRSMHTNPTPRIGGIGIVLGVAAALILLGTTASAELGFIAGGLALASLIDDKWSLPVAVRLPAHFLLAGAFVALFPPPLWLFPIVVLGVVWTANLYNFMDGMDGLAGGMAVFGFLAYTVAAAWAAAADLSALSAAVAGAAAGFLIFNTHPAKVFMGDVGAIPLGFLAAAIGYLGIIRGLWPLWFPFLVFSPFVVDATITLMCRAIAGEKVLEAHNTHCYQRMSRSKLGQVQTVRWWYAAMAAAALSSLALLQASLGIVILVLALWALFYILAVIFVDQSTS